MYENKSCEMCAHYIGGAYAYCRIGLEDDCADSDYELWEPRFPDAIAVI